MNVVLGVPLLLLGLLAWMGQVLSAVAPVAAARMGLTESPEIVDPTFMADIRAECRWDSLTLWTLPLAAALLLVNHEAWQTVGLVGGAVYVYFAGRGVLQRIEMARRRITIGKASNARLYFVFLGLWGAAGGAMIAAVLSSGRG